MEAEIVAYCECGKVKFLTNIETISKKWPSCDCNQFLKVSTDVNVLRETTRDRMGNANGTSRPAGSGRILYRS